MQTESCLSCIVTLCVHWNSYYHFFCFLLITDNSSCADLAQHSSAYSCFQIEGSTLIVGREAEKSQVHDLESNTIDEGKEPKKRNSEVGEENASLSRNVDSSLYLQYFSLFFVVFFLFSCQAWRPVVSRESV